MQLDHLRLFRDIAQFRSVSRAASTNGVSQSAASQHVQDLERSFGADLLDRSTRPLTVTEAGLIYLDYCRDLLRRDDEFQVSLSRLKTEVHGTVRVAAIYSVGLPEMNQLERELVRRFPEGRLEVEYLRPERVYEAVLSDRADIGLLSYPEATREVVVLPWREEPMVVAVAPSHPLANKTRLSARELNEADFIAFDEDLPIRREVDRYLREHGTRVNIAFHFDNLQMIKEAVAHGAGISIVPGRILTQEVAQGRIVAIPITAPELYRPVGIIHRRRKRFHRIAQALLDLLREQRTTPELSAFR